MQNGWSLSRSREMRLPGCAGEMVLVFVLLVEVLVGICFVLLLVLVIVLLFVFRCESISGTYPEGWLIGPNLF